EAERRAAEASSIRDDLRSEIDELRGERNDAVRQLKEVESEVGRLRHDIRIARAATREAERELEELRARSDADQDRPAASASVPRGDRNPTAAAPVESGVVTDPGFDREALRDAVA